MTNGEGGQTVVHPGAVGVGGCQEPPPPPATNMIKWKFYSQTPLQLHLPLFAPPHPPSCWLRVVSNYT